MEQEARALCIDCLLKGHIPHGNTVWGTLTLDLNYMQWGDGNIQQTEGECCKACQETEGCNVWWVEPSMLVRVIW